jgi:6-phosphogluconolactonase
MQDIVEFSGPEALAAATTDRVTAALAQGLATRGAASLVVPGGRTPAAFLTELGAADLDWSRITVTLSDERWVAATAPESNEAMLRRTLLRGPAAAARFVPLYDGAATPAAGVAGLTARLASAPQPWDAVVLGMGDDGHFASLFPGEAALAQGLDPVGALLAVAARGPAEGPPRLSLTLACLARAEQILILASGAVKRRLWQDAADAQPQTLPVAALRHLSAPPLTFLWCP